ncbi:tryptophan synthase subunit alpha [bacterium]|nr:tryptophan synthase subunit alpha [bacterium]MBU3929851.1 tryptophan synthase subunit alpha [bacterium]MBU4123004.1 tryptophan synthase subunit alpha [bacterium]
MKSQKRIASALSGTVPNTIKFSVFEGCGINAAARGKALNIFFVAGVPDMKTSAEALRKLPACGCDIIEIGVPYSDPLADGPVIRGAYTMALKKGVTLKKVLELVKAERKNVPVPIVLMIYSNLVLRKGADNFIREAVGSGVNGVIVPDMMYPYSKDFALLCRESGLAFIPLVAPATEKERIKEISASGDGFLYYVNVEGITGAREKLPAGIASRLREVSEASVLPVMSGFGISRPEHVKAIKKYVDGVIVGSAVQKELNAGRKPWALVKELKCSFS